MDILQQDNGATGKFYMSNGDRIIAEMIYTRKGINCIEIEHTEVDESLKGQGVGKKLLNELVAFARAKQLSIIPACSYAKAVMEKTNEYDDVLDKK